MAPVIWPTCGFVNIELELELYFYLDTVNLSDKIIILLQSIITVTIYFNLYKHDLKFKSKIEKKNKEILLYIDAVCVLSIQRKKLRQQLLVVQCNIGTSD